MIALGIAKDSGHLGKVLTSLLSVTLRTRTVGNKQKVIKVRRPKEIGQLDFGTQPGKGRLHRMYYLAKRGAELLEVLDPDLAPVRFPARVVEFEPDYHHRVDCVDFQMTVEAWAQAADQTVIDFRQYFDWSKATAGQQPAPVTRLSLTHKRVDADAIFLLRDPSGIERSFFYEMARGTGTGRVLKKMEHLARGIDDGSLNRALSFPAEKAVRILFVFEHPRTAELVVERADTFPLLSEYTDHFLLKTLADLNADTFRQGWLPLDPQAVPRPLFGT